MKLDGDATAAIIADGTADVIAGDEIILEIYNFSCYENVFNVLMRFMLFCCENVKIDVNMIVC